MTACRIVGARIDTRTNDRIRGSSCRYRPRRPRRLGARAARRRQASRPCGDSRRPPWPQIHDRHQPAARRKLAPAHRRSTYADAILDRLVHNGHRIELRGESLRNSSDGRPQGSGHDFGGKVGRRAGRWISDASQRIGKAPGRARPDTNGFGRGDKSDDAVVDVRWTLL